MPNVGLELTTPEIKSYMVHCLSQPLSPFGIPAAALSGSTPVFSEADTQLLLIVPPFGPVILPPRKLEKPQQL